MDDQQAAVLREGRTVLPLQRWLWAPGLGLAAFVIGMVVWRSSGSALALAAGVTLLAAAVLAAKASWRWRITPTHIEVGRLGWPVLRGGRSMHLSRVGKVEVRTGNREQVWDAVSFSRGEGRLFPWMHGALVVDQGVGIGVAGPDVISPLQAAGQRIVIGTGTAEEAREAAQVLRDAVRAIRERYPIPREHHVRVVTRRPAPPEPAPQAAQSVPQAAEPVPQSVPQAAEPVPQPVSEPSPAPPEPPPAPQAAEPEPELKPELKPEPEPRPAEETPPARPAAAQTHLAEPVAAQTPAAEPAEPSVAETPAESTPPAAASPVIPAQAPANQPAKQPAKKAAPRKRTTRTPAASSTTRAASATKKTTTSKTSKSKRPPRTDPPDNT